MKRSRLFFFLVLFTSITFVVTSAEPAEQHSHKNGDIQTGRPALTRDLVAMVNASRQAPDPVMQRYVAAQPGVKIAVNRDGVYRVSRTELEAASFPVDSDPANWRLFLDGNEQSIIVGDGNEYVDFYGRGIDTFETDTRIYYLISDTVPGRRMVSKILNSIGGNVISNNYRFNTVKKERLFYFSEIQNGDVENYFGRWPDPSFVLTERFTLTSVDPQGPDSIIQINMQGLTNTAHSIQVSVNGTAVGALTGSGAHPFGRTFVVPAGLLTEGTNSIGLSTAFSNDLTLFDSINVNYSRRYAADQDRILFYTPGYRRANVTGFTSPNIRVFDTTLDGDPQLIVNPLTVQDGGTYTVRMPSNRPAVFYAVEDSGLLHSPSVTFNNPSTLASPDNSADIVIVSYGSADFMAAAETWANYRRRTTGGGFNVKVVDVADVFDEFSYGLHTAQAIKDFLAYAHSNWQSPVPAYVLLLGDASYDRRNYEGYGYWDLVPTKNVSLTWEETGSDDALADFNDPPDGVADMAIGRIPARSPADIVSALNKTIAFETPANQMLSRGALFAYDPPYGYNFGDECHQFRNQLPRTMPVLFIPRDSPMAHQHLIDGINAGKYIVGFCGHASASVWGSQDFFSIADIPLLINDENPSIFAVLDGFNAFFMRPNSDSLGEALLKAPNGGAAVTWASSTEVTPDYQLVLGLQFYNLLGAGNIPRMGDVVNASKQSIAGSNIGYSWALLGDPAMKVR